MREQRVDYNPLRGDGTVIADPKRKSLYLENSCIELEALTCPTERAFNKSWLIYYGKTVSAENEVSLQGTAYYSPPFEKYFATSSAASSRTQVTGSWAPPTQDYKWKELNYLIIVRWFGFRRLSCHHGHESFCWKDFSAVFIKFWIADCEKSFLTILCLGLQIYFRITWLLVEKLYRD